ncbi:glycosyltransferase [Pelosinus propionicus]|nr:glycosyltransferase [Pelosinus propionicus]
MQFNYQQQPGRTLINRNLIIDDKEPLMTIITPYYNAGKFIRQTANCVFNQTFPYYEWIIVNDGSTNKEDVDVLDLLVQEDSRVKVFHKENGGPGSGRNMAIRESTTGLIVILDADDLIDPTYLECAYFTLQTNPDAQWCYSDSVGFNKAEHLWKYPFITERLKKNNFLLSIAVIRKSALAKVGLYDERVKHAYEDWHLWLKLLKEGMYPVHMNYYGTWYRKSDDGVYGQVNNDEGKYGKAIEFVKEVSKFVDDTIKAIEYPLANNNNFKKPVSWTWDKKAILGDEKCKILMIIPWMTVGGADSYNLDLVANIDKSKFEVSIITTIPSQSEWRQKFEEHVTDIFDLSTFLHVENWCAFIHYFIKSRGIDIVMISNSYYGYYLIPWLRKEFPNISIVDCLHMEEWYWRSGGYARTSGVLGDILDRSYVSTEHLKTLMVEYFKRNETEIKVIKSGVDEKYFDPAIIKAGEIKAEVGISFEEPVVLYLCRMHQQKRPFLMIDIAEELRKRIQNVKFFAVGNGPELGLLKSEVRKREMENTLHFFGTRTDLPKFYKDSDVTLICSIKEGIAVITYESLAMGVPVVSSDVGAQRELIDDTVGCVLPIMQEEEKDFADIHYSEIEILQYVDAIEEILKDKVKYGEMQKECRLKILENHTKTIFINTWQKEFLKLKSGYWKGKREKLNEVFKLIPNLADDYFTIFLEMNLAEFQYSAMSVRLRPIEEFIDKAKNRQVFIWGASNGGKKTLDHLRNANISGTVAFIDNDPNKAGSLFCELPVYSPKVLEELLVEDKKPFVFIGSMYVESIKSSLENIGLKANVDFADCLYIL